MVALVTVVSTVVATGSCLVTTFTVLLGAALCGTLKIVVFTSSMALAGLTVVVVGVIVTSFACPSLSESLKSSELLRLLLPLPSVFLTTVAVGVTATAAAVCCCFTNGNGILIINEDGDGLTVVRFTSIDDNDDVGLLAILTVLLLNNILLGFCGSLLEATGDLLSIRGT